MKRSFECASPTFRKGSKAARSGLENPRGCPQLGARQPGQEGRKRPRKADPTDVRRRGASVTAAYGAHQSYSLTATGRRRRAMQVVRNDALDHDEGRMREIGMEKGAAVALALSHDDALVLFRSWRGRSTIRMVPDCARRRSTMVSSGQ
jgi:hypothetical protein